MAAAMATANAVPVTVGSFRGQQVRGACRGPVSVAVRSRSSVLQVRAETNSERYARKGQQNAEAAANESQTVGKKILNQLFGGAKDAQKDVKKNADKAQTNVKVPLANAMANIQNSLKGGKDAGKEVEEKTGNVLEDMEGGLKKAVREQQEMIQKKKDELLNNKD